MRIERLKCEKLTGLGTEDWVFSEGSVFVLCLERSLHKPLSEFLQTLFYEDIEEMVSQAIADPASHATSFGYAGTYWDYVREIALECGGLKDLMSLDITKDEIVGILKEAGFKGYRFDGALEWIVKTIQMISNL